MENSLQGVNNMHQLEEIIGSKEQTEFELVHTFSEGIYTRELHIPKGTCLVGKRHRKKTLNILLKGKMTIYDGDSSVYIEAPFMFEADKYTKKAGYAHEDSIWVNIHPTSSTDLKEIEKEFIIPESEYLSLGLKEEL